MVTPTDDGLAWDSRRRVGDAPGEIDTVAIGTGSDVESAAATTLQNEIYRATTADSVVTISEDTADPTLQYVTIELTGGLEIPAGTEVTEMGAIVSATSPETLVMYDVSSPVSFDSGARNKLTIPIDTAGGDD